MISKMTMDMDNGYEIEIYKQHQNVALNIKYDIKFDIE